jgi:hypothetical protein
MSTVIVAISEEAAQGLEQAASHMGVSTGDLAEKAIRRYLRQEAERKIEQEEAHYQSQHTELLEQYKGRYIAMHNGQVIDTDSDELALYLRIRQKYPMVGILIKRVTSEAKDVWHMRSPRLEYH